MRVLAALVAGGIALGLGCSGHHGTGARDGGAPAPAPAGTDAGPVVPEPVLRPLGGASPDDFGYRRGPARGAYHRARVAERKGDWPAVVAACRDARVADPHHIDAAWLEAAALAREGKLAEVTAPLSVAASGDWGRWGERSLTLPLLADFRASPYGAAWRRAADRYRAAYEAALARAVLVVVRRGPAAGAGAPGGAGLFGYDPAGRRWLRLSRSRGEVVAVLTAPGAPYVAYVALRDVRVARGVERRFRIGAVDRQSGRSGRELALGALTRVRMAWRPEASGEPALEIETTAGHARAQHGRVDWRRGTRRKARGRLPGHGIEVTGHGAHLTRLPVADVTADWDDDGTASALRVETSKQTVEPPALIDGNTLVWAPDRARLAFATAPAAPCATTAPPRAPPAPAAPPVTDAPAPTAPAAHVYVADAATGKVRALGPADNPGQLRWLDADHLAYVTGGAVRVVDVARGAETARIAGGAGVSLDGWIARRGCARGDAEPVFAVDPDEPGEPDADADVDNPGAPPDLAEPAGRAPAAPARRDAGVSDGAAPSDAGR